MKLMKNKKYLQRKFSQKVPVPQTSRVSKSDVPFTCKFPMVMHFVPILHKRCRSKTHFYVFVYDKASLKFCASFRIFLAVFREKFPKIHYLNYVRRGIGHFSLSINIEHSYSACIIYDLSNTILKPLTYFKVRFLVVNGVGAGSRSNFENSTMSHHYIALRMLNHQQASRSYLLVEEKTTIFRVLKLLYINLIN